MTAPKTDPTDSSAPPALEGDGAADVHYEGRDLEILSAMARYHRWIVDQFKPHLGGQTVEYGAGIGTFSKLILPFVDALRIVEPSATLLPDLRRAFEGQSKVAVVGRTLEADVAALPERSVDTFILINVLEHVADDEDAVRRFFKALKPGGRLLLFVPALDWLFSRLDRQYGHHRRYHLGPMTAMLRRGGFGAVEGRYMDVMGVLPWWVMNTCLGKTDFNPGLMAVYDRVFVPASRVLEGLVTPPIGKNIIVVARKD